MRLLLLREADPPARRSGQQDLHRLRLTDTPPEETTGPPPAGRDPRPWIAAAASGALLAAARAPLAFGPLALVALAPLLWAWRGCRPRRAAALGLVAGVVYHTMLLSWIWYFGAVAIIPFVAALAGYWALIGAVVGWFGTRGVRNPLLTAGAWVAGEALTARFPFGGFSWGEVGYALSGVPAARALASWGGVALVSFAVVALTHLGVDLASALRARTPARAGRAVAGVALAAALCLVAATFRVEPRSTGMLRFALVQGNDLNRDLDANERADRYIPRRHFDLAARLSGRYDLVVFPESSMDADPRHDPWLAERLAATARAHDAWVLTNAVTDHPDGRAVNLDLLYGPDGSLRGTYAKRHLVPFGEYVPFRRVLEPLIPQLDQIPRDFAPGHRAETFAVGRHRIGTVICFEIAFGPLVRETVRQGADVVVVSTNNRSYRRSAQAAQHLAISQMRAAETGRPVLHASINGITGVVDHTGRIVERTHLFVNSVTTGEVEGTTGETIYVRLGEWVPALSAAGLLAAAAATRRRRGLPPGPSVESPGPTER